MEDKKANIIAASTVIALIIFIIVARVSLKLSNAFFLILGADIAIIIAVFSWMIIRMRYNRRRKLLETQLVSEGRELRIEYSFLRKVAGVPTKKWQYFPKIVNEKLKEGKLMEIVDHRLTLGGGGGIDERQLKRLVYVAFWCIQENVRLRPSIARVVEMLEGRVAVEEPPDTQMVIVDLLSMDEDQQPEAGHERKRIAKLVSPVDRNVPTTSMRSFSMSVLSGR
ncbi:hypothetical protein EZV62_012672 [Acer yangbiense]|uniref:Serine-threonine/tyrosine-protein kinase catalytic domain-containing protein n=1 Tax=Acer yangbiense TaxID=1000413 RepID=A0A5C7HX95_9ROSI|nr:hypothetical protein EZV62_012672 [Acer yangbiense]